MDAICEELDETQDLKKLTEECRIKTEMADSLKKANHDQLIKIKDMKIQIENQAEELKAKTMEIDDFKCLYDELNSKYKEKEMVVRHLTATNEQVRATHQEAIRKLKKEKEELLIILDGSTTKSQDQEKDIQTYKEEIEGLRKALSISERKRSGYVEKVDAMLTSIKQLEQDIEDKNANLLELSKDKVDCDSLKAKLAEFEEKYKKESAERVHVQNTLEELKRRDGILHKIERDLSISKEQLKWKKEQFQHLEEAHKKLQDEFSASRLEWEVEKARLLDEMISLQNGMESQRRILEDTKDRLEMCNQALAHEESRRKSLEIQVKDSQSGYENILDDYKEMKAMVDGITSRSDEEIAALRSSLQSKEIQLKEMDFKMVHLQEENVELHKLVDELKETQTHENGAVSCLRKLRENFKTLEEIHKECHTTLRAKEIEWDHRVHEAVKELDSCQFEINSKETRIKELEMELGTCESLFWGILAEKEEASICLLLTRSGYLQSQVKIDDLKSEFELYTQQRLVEIARLKDLVDEKSRKLSNAEVQIERKEETIRVLSERIDSLESLEKEHSDLRIELKQQRHMFDESLKCHGRLKQEYCQAVESLNKDLRKAADELDSVNADLARETSLGINLKFELQRWKLLAENLQSAKIEAGDQEKSHHEQVEELEKELEAVRTAAQEKCEKDIKRYQQIIDAKDDELDELKSQVFAFKQKIGNKKDSTFKKDIEIKKLSDALVESRGTIERMTTCWVVNLFELHLLNSLTLDSEYEMEDMQEEIVNEKQYSSQLKHQLGMLESDWNSRLNVEKDLLARQAKEIEQLTSKLSHAVSPDCNMRKLPSDVQLEPAVIKDHPEPEKQLLEAKEQIQLLEDELLKSQHAEEVLLSIQSQQLEELNDKLRSIKSTRSEACSTSSNLKEENRVLMNELAAQEKLSATLKEKIQLLEVEIDEKSCTISKMLGDIQEQAHEYSARLLLVDAVKRDLDIVNARLGEECQTLEHELESKGSQVSELYEKMQLLETELFLNVHCYELQLAICREETEYSNAELRQMENGNTNLRNTVSDLSSNLNYAKGTIDKQNIEIQCFQDRLQQLDDVIRSWSIEREEWKRRIVFLATFSHQLDKLCNQSSNLVDSCHSVVGNFPSITDEEEDDNSATNTVAEWIRDNRNLVGNLESDHPKREMTQANDEEYTKASMSSLKHRSDDNIERSPFKVLNI